MSVNFRQIAFLSRTRQVGHVEETRGLVKNITAYKAILLKVLRDVEVRSEGGTKEGDEESAPVSAPYRSTVQVSGKVSGSHDNPDYVFARFSASCHLDLTPVGEPKTYLPRGNAPSAVRNLFNALRMAAGCFAKPRKHG